MEHTAGHNGSGLDGGTRLKGTRASLSTSQRGATSWRGSANGSIWISTNAIVSALEYLAHGIRLDRSGNGVRSFGKRIRKEAIQPKKTRKREGHVDRTALANLGREKAIGEMPKGNGANSESKRIYNAWPDRGGAVSLTAVQSNAPRHAVYCRRAS